MALMDNILNTTDALHLDKLLQNFEFENKQCVKLIEKENQQIEALKKAIEERKSEIGYLRLLINQLDDNTKRSHKQFTQNRDNCESLRKTTIVLMEHEFALNKKLNSIVSTSDHDRGERESVLQHYKNIWDDYESVYKSFPLAIELHEETTEFAQLNLQVEEAKKQADNLQKRIRQVLGDEDVNFKNLNNFIIKIAEIKIETTRILNQIQTSVKERDDFEKVVETFTDSKKNGEESDELMEIDGVEESESQSTMIGMFCNVADGNEEEDILTLNTNNNKEINTIPINGITHTVDTVKEQEASTIHHVSASKDHQKAKKIGVENQISNQLCSVPPSIQITEPTLIHQKMPSRMRVNDANTGNQFEVQRKSMPNQVTKKKSVPQPKICNQPRLLTPFTSQQRLPKTKTQESIQRPPLLIPQQFHPSPMIRKIQTPASVQSVNETSDLLTGAPHQHQHKTFSFLPTILHPVSRSSTDKDTSTQPSVVHDRTKMLNDQVSPGNGLSREKQSPLPTPQNETASNKTPKTPESALSCIGKTSISPFDINKHKEHLKQMWNVMSPNVKPLKGRSMFCEETRKSSPKFNISAFSNVSSQDTPGGRIFSLESTGASPEEETNYMSLFRNTPSTAHTANASSFSFSFDGNDSSETSGFTLNFGSPEPEESTMFNLF